jgi:uncharacterized protein
VVISLNRLLSDLDHHPVRSNKGGFAASYLLSRPPLLGEEGNFRRKGRGYILTASRACLLAFCFLFLPALHAAETPIPPAPTRWVTDTAHFMSPQAAASLDSRLQSYEQSTGHQLIVYIGQTTGDAPIDDWAVRAFQKWKVGRKGIDDGLVLFIMAADRKLRFEVGYGLEPTVPDAIASRVINEVIVPRIQNGDPDGAVTSGMDAVMTVIGGGSLPAAPRAAQRGREPQSFSLGQLILFGIIGLIVLAVFITNPSLAMYLLFSILSGGRGGGGRDDWGGGGGGFGGGGGRSGGGGASGSW